MLVLLLSLSLTVSAGNCQSKSSDKKVDLHMSETFVIILATAVSTSVMTLLLAYLFHVFYVRKRMEKRMQELAEIVQERVRAGAIEAGSELLPCFREQVTEGFKRALREWSTNDFRKMTKTGMGMVEESLSSLLGARQKPSSRED